jgi:hypothetical protein
MKKFNRKNPHGRRPQQNSSKSALSSKGSSQQNIAGHRQITKSAHPVTEEAIDVLSLMGFKL